MDDWMQGVGWKLWYVHAPVSITVQATPAVCLLALTRAARPNLQRLHLRNLFTEGRRYYVQPRPDGFRLMSNSTVAWNSRARTALAAVVEGAFSDAGDGATRVSLQARWRILYLLDVFFVPVFMMSILVFVPWPSWVLTVFATSLLVLSWLWHRLTATLQATDILYFAQRALEDLPTADRPLLTPPTPEVITVDAAFHEAWEAFYRQQTDESE